MRTNFFKQCFHKKIFNYYTLEGIGSVFIDVELMDEDMEVTDMICVLSTFVQISEIWFGLDWILGTKNMI